MKKEIIKGIAKKDILNEAVRAKQISDQVIQSLKAEIKQLEVEMNEVKKGNDISEEVLKHEILEVNSKYDILHLEEEKNKSVILNLINEVAELQVATNEKKALILKMRDASERMEEKLLIENKDMFTDFEIVLPELRDAINLYEELKL